MADPPDQPALADATAASDQTEAGRPIEMRLPRLTARRIALLVGLGLLTLALLVAVGGGRDAIIALTQVDGRYIALAMLVHYSGFAVRGHRWQRLLGMMGHQLTYLFATALLLAGWFVSALLPARAGDLLRIAVLRLPGQTRQPVPVADSLGSIVLERALDISAILVLGAGFSLLVARNRLPAWVASAYILGIGLLFALGLAVVVAPPLLNWLGRRSSHRLWTSLIAFTDQFVLSLRTLFRHPATALLVMVESLYIWGCDVALLWLVIRSLGQSASIADAGFVALTVDVTAAVPLTPGGIGQIDAVYAALLALVAGSAYNVAAVVLVTRLVSYWSFLLFSGVVTFAAGFGAMLMENNREIEEEQTNPALDPIEPGSL